MTFSNLQLTGDIDSQQVEPYVQDKADLQQSIEEMTRNVETLKNVRKEIPHNITVKDLPVDQQFEALRVESKLLIDTIKMIAYQAECALTETLREYLSDREDACMLVKRILTSDAEIIPDNE